MGRARQRPHDAVRRRTADQARELTTRLVASLLRWAVGDCGRRLAQAADPGLRAFGLVGFGLTLRHRPGFCSGACDNWFGAHVWRCFAPAARPSCAWRPSPVADSLKPSAQRLFESPE